MYKLQTHTNIKGEPLETTIYETVIENVDTTQTNGTKRSKFDEYIGNDPKKPEIRAAKTTTPIEDDQTNSNTNRISDRIKAKRYMIVSERKEQPKQGLTTHVYYMQHQMKV